jgi:lipopolysaccharide biosynthesis glycosyltransferase
MTNNVYIGFEPREAHAYDIAKHSILRQTKDVNVYPLKLNELKNLGLVTREDDKLSATEFTFTRYLVPYLNQYKGWALFIDCDFLILEDINKLFALADDEYAVMVAKHQYGVKDGSIKMDGQVQHAYPRKNWSSCMLFNCEHPSNYPALDPIESNTQQLSYLHRFQWLKDEEIGEFSHEWNWLIGHYHEPEDGKPKVLHYTLGIPEMEGYENCEYSDLWYKEQELMKNE